MHSDVKQKSVCPKPGVKTTPVQKIHMCVFFKALNVCKAIFDPEVTLPLCSMHQKAVDYARFLLSNSEDHPANEKILAMTIKCLSPKGSQTCFFCPPTLFNISKSESRDPCFEK